MCVLASVSLMMQPEICWMLHSRDATTVETADNTHHLDAATWAIPRHKHGDLNGGGPCQTLT